MPVIHRGTNWTINMYADDHGLPHFHVRAPDGEAVIAIATLAILAGDVPPRIMAEVKTWAAANRPLLAAKWKQLNS